MKLRKYGVTGFVALFLVFAVFAGSAFAETKIGVMNIQKVIATSKAGKSKTTIESKLKEVQASFKEEEEAPLALQQEIEKGTVWSEEIKAKKIRDFNIKKRDLKQRTDDARFEMRQLEKKELQPILKKLDEVVKTFAEKNGYTIIFDIKAGVVFLDRKIDVTDQLITALDNVTE